METDWPSGFSYIWEALAPDDKLRIEILPPDEPAAGDLPVAFFGVGLRHHSPYVVDVGAPFDDLALGGGWRDPQQENEVTYRWTDSRARLTFFLPAAFDIGLSGEVLLRVASRRPEGPPAVPVEVFWDGKKLGGKAVATKDWSIVRLSLPGPPAPGRHELMIRSPIFYAPDPRDPKHQLRMGIMVDKVSIE
jgi:hypothetical protein